MRKIFIALSVAVFVFGPGVTNCLPAGENNTGKRPDLIQPAESRGDEETAGTRETKKEAEEAKEVVVARVNGVDVSMYGLIRAMNAIAPKYIKKGEQPDPGVTEKIRKEALDRLIFEELAVQQAIKEGINPKPEAIENVVKQVKKNLVTEEAYKDYLDKRDLTEDALKKLIERSQRYEMITAKEIYRKVKVDERLVRAEYEKEKKRYILPENLAVDDVLFLQGKDEDAARKKAGEVLDKIRRNNNDVWKLVLDGTFIVREMKITRERNPEIHKVITGMEVGDLSGVFKDKDGLHIIKVIKKEPPRQATFEEAKATIEPEFLVTAQDERREEWETELKKNARIERMQPDPGKTMKEKSSRSGNG